MLESNTSRILLFVLSIITILLIVKYLPELKNIVDVGFRTITTNRIPGV